MATLRLRVNGRTRSVEADGSTPLAYVIRNQLGLTGTKIGCGLEQCGSCAVLVDGESTLSCVAPVAQFEDRDIVTIEGLVDDGAPGPVQAAFIEAGAAQCGYCTPGLVIAVTALLGKRPAASEREVREALSPHLCRCGSHPRVLRAVRRLAGREQ
ncbi:MAG: (2Fe-2S)-binding protein [Gammaproteobacteria bacterium]|nr:(2Fe-2S)-binding protein [Gammaproteobacteria bacterium]